MTDVLTPLIEAYRAENAATSLDARALRTRVLQASARRGQSPLRHAKWLLPVAATFIVTGALAATPVARPLLTNLLARLAAFTATSAAPHAVRRAPLPAPPPGLTLAPHPDLPNSPALRAPAPVPALAPAAAPEAFPHNSTPRPGGAAPDAFPSAPTLPSRDSAAEPSPSPHASSGASRAAHASPTSDSSAVSDAAPSNAVASSAHSAAGVPPPPVPPPVPPLTPDLNAYSVAHRLHFTNGDYAGALTAWNSYLAHFPHGTFAPEARLNRAVCLARLGRTQEARTQLQAIAKDKTGSYGAQARRLLAAMDSP
jgi:hypothetical protein